MLTCVCRDTQHDWCCADYDTVELANMNRLFFRPEHCGMTKTDAAAKTLGTQRAMMCAVQRLNVWCLWCVCCASIDQHKAKSTLTWRLKATT